MYVVYIYYSSFYCDSGGTDCINNEHSCISSDMLMELKHRIIISVLAVCDWNPILKAQMVFINSTSWGNRHVLEN